MKTVTRLTFSELTVDLETDKQFRHNYGPTYDMTFPSELRDSVRKCLEIGVQWGPSLRLWERYFPEAQIVGIDINPQCKQFESPRSAVRIGSQSDVAFLQEVTQEFGPWDVVIDDGSHRFSDIVASFKVLWPHVLSGGWYVVEDLQVSGQAEFGGDPGLGENTSSGYLARLLNELMAGSPSEIVRSVVAAGIVCFQKK